jgi:hypothetical protein
MIIVLPPKSYPEILDLINETEQIDQILIAGADENSNIFCLAIEAGEKISVKIGDTIDVLPFLAPQTAQMAAPENITLDFVDRAIDRLRQKFPFKPWLQQAKELLMQSSSLEDYSASLVDLYPEMPSDDFNQIMLDALTAASMAGYFDAESEMDEDAEFKMVEGTSKFKDGKVYTLRNSRWHKNDLPSSSEMESALGKLYTRESRTIGGWVSKLDRLPKTEDAEEEKIEIINRLYKEIYDTGMDLEDATKLADDIKYTNLNKRELDETRNAAIEFFRIHNGGLRYLKEFKSASDRAYANTIGGYIDVGDWVVTSTVFHEMGHFAENQSGWLFIDKTSNYRAKNSDFIKSRATGEPGLLSVLADNSGYDDDEVAYPDKFIHPYVGKIYEDGETEVLSMGFEYFTSSDRMLELWNKDSEHFKLMITYLQERRRV